MEEQILACWYLSLRLQLIYSSLIIEGSVAVILIIAIGISICIAYFLHQKYAAEDTEDSLNTQSDGENADSKESAVQIEIRLSSDSGKESAVICGLNEQMKKYGTIQRDLMIERN